MNHNQRKNKTFRSDNLAKNKLAHELSSVPKSKCPVSKSRSPVRISATKDDKSMVNRCCLVHPKQKDFAHITKLDDVETINVPQTDQYTNILSEQYGFNPVQAKIISEMKWKNVLCGNGLKVENSSQCDYTPSFSSQKCVETADGTQWQNIDNIDDVDKYIQATIHRDSATSIEHRSKPISIHISEIPKVKIIVEKFSKFKRHNVELRRLEEKVVCIEYDIYNNSSTSSMNKPIQTMRAFFSVKPAYDDGKCETPPLTELPENIKDKFKILDEDLKKLTIKEIEIIDDSIKNNKCYLDDLRRILRRQHLVNVNKDKNSIDLKTLYEMARRENESLCTNTSFFSNSELQELKKLIMQRSTSSAHGISRRRIRTKNEPKLGEGVLSRSIVSELMR